MSTGQRLRQVKEDIARIERFLPVLKRVLTMLRVEIRGYSERVDELAGNLSRLDEVWADVADETIAQTIEISVTVECLTRPDNLVGVDVDVVKSFSAHCGLSQALICSSATAAAITDLAVERKQCLERLRIERRNLASLEDAEEEFVFLINGSEQVRLPPLRQELTRLARQMDEENGMAATIARILRERPKLAATEQELELWQPLI
jgi:hypothetical protein